MDKITLEVVRCNLIDITREMKAVTMRAAPTNIWKESGDLSCGLLDPDCELVAQGPEDLPAHLATMPFSAKGILARFPLEEMREGDVFFHNDPAAGNNHLPDCMMLMPVFFGGSLVGFAAVRGHWADIGGMGPGSYTTRTTDPLQEGIRVPPIRVVSAGTVDNQLLDLLLANVRGAELRRGDFFSQFSGCRRGALRLQELCQRYGAGTLRRCMGEILDYGERLTRAEIEKIPDGTYRFEDHYDGDGVTPGPFKVTAALTVRGSEIVVDLTGSSEQAIGGMNSPLAVTHSAIYFAIKAVTDPWNPANSGSYRPISVVAPLGSMFNPHLPAPVIGCNSEVGIILSDVCIGALAQACPERVTAAGSGSGVIVVCSGTWSRDPRSRFLFMEALGSAGGASAGADGWSGYRVGVGNMGISSLEVLEMENPIRNLAFELPSGWGGDGRFRGGSPGRHVFQLLHEAVVTITAERGEHGPFGLEDGEAGSRGAYLLDPGTDQERRLFSKTEPMLLPAGSVLSITPAGGGGFGPSGQRDPALREKDRQVGYV